MQQKIFVTGGTGFLGAYLLRYLVKQGFKNIRAIKRSNSKMDLVASVQDQIDWVEGDVLDLPFLDMVLDGMDQVYHCAALISFDPKDEGKMLEVNEIGTSNMVNLCLHHNIQKFIYISSIAAIGKAPIGELTSESTKWKSAKNNSPYSISKYAAEMQVWRGIAEGLNAAILNPSVILGSGFWDSGSTKIFNLYGKGFPFYSDGANGFVDVRDVARFAIILMESNISQERFLINGENLPFQKVVKLISQYARVKPPYIKITPFLSAIAWRLAWLVALIRRKSPTLTKSSLQSALGSQQYANQKSIDAFNFHYTPIEQTLQETVAQFLDAQQNSLPAAVLPLN